LRIQLVPLGLGILAILMGIALIAYGIPIYEFGTGNTLIGAGFTCLVGGLVLLGVWAGVVELNRLRSALAPGSIRGAASRAPEVSQNRPADRAGDRERGEFSPSRGGRGGADEAAERERRLSSEAEESPGRRSWPPEEEQVDTSEPEYGSRAEAEPVREEQSSWELFAPSRSSGSPRTRSFEAIWPSDQSDQDRRAAPAESSRRAGPERERDPGVGSEPAKVLKSGVINGMAYTLYTDGSIEAELPQGTLRFGSLDELRDYLAENP
jgi:hypothetical protein